MSSPGQIGKQTVKFFCPVEAVVLSAFQRFSVSLVKCPTNISLIIKDLHANTNLFCSPVAEFHFSTPYYIEGCVVALGPQAGFPDPAITNSHDKQGKLLRPINPPPTATSDCLLITDQCR